MGLIRRNVKVLLFGLAACGSCLDEPEPEERVCTLGVADGNTVDEERFSNDDELRTLTDCDVVVGDVRIRDDVTTLLPLSRVTRIQGGLEISGDRFATLSGLDRLERVEGTFFLIGSFSLRDLSGLNALTSIGGELIIEQNAQLESFVGMESLTEVGDGVFVECNSPLLTAQDVSELEEQLGRSVGFVEGGVECGS